MLWWAKPAMHRATLARRPYTARVIGGAVAIRVRAVRMAAGVLRVHLSWASVDQTLHLNCGARIENGLDDPRDGNYQLSDSSVVAALAAASAFNAVTIFPCISVVRR